MLGLAHGGKPGGRAARRIPAVLLVGLTVATTVLTAAAAPAPAAAAEPGFVTRSGRGLELDGRPFRFTGMNIYAANSDGWCGEDYDAEQLRTALDGMGSRDTVLRAWFFQTLAAQKGPDGAWTGARDWSRFDQTLAVAAEKGVKVVVTLTDQWGECGDGGHSGFKDKDWYLGGYNEPDPVLAARYAQWVSYREWVTEVVTRYKDDPTILAWQLVNEAEVKESQGAGCPTGDPANPLDHGNILRDFAQDISGLVRSIDANHLISLGTIGSGQCGAQDWQYSLIHALPNIDLCEFHDYGTLAMPGDQWNGLQVRLNQCAALDKPLFVGESGITPNWLPEPSLEARAQLYDAKFRAQFAAGVAGILVWDYRRTGSTLETYDIGDGDPTLLRLQAWSAGCTWRPAETPPVACGPVRDAQLDPSFGHNGKVVTYGGAPSIGDSYYAVAVQADGRILAGGQAYNTDRDLLLARYNTDGTPDTGFATGGRRIDSFTRGGENINALAVQPDGRIVAVGGAERTAGYRSNDFFVARYEPDGDLDPSFGDGGHAFIDFAIASETSRDDAHAVALYADGRILVGGYSQEMPHVLAMVRLMPDGTPDPSFGDGGKVRAANGSASSKVIIEPAGHILAIGGNRGPISISRFHSDGSPDLAYGTDGVTTLAVDESSNGHAAERASDGSVFVGGFANAGSSAGLAGYAVTKVRPDGVIDGTFGSNGRVVTQLDAGWEAVQDLRLQRDGRILVVGYTNSGNFDVYDHDAALVRYEADGTVDDTFGIAGIARTDLGSSSEIAYGMALQADGRALAVGQTSNATGLGSGFVTRYLAGPAAAPAGSPSVPVDVTATPGNGLAKVSWTAVSDGGSPISAFTITAEPGGAQASVASGSSATVTGLTNGTAYTFTVEATNAIGASGPSAPSEAVTPLDAAPPSEPIDVTAQPGDGEVTLTWVAPADNGLPITGYTVETANALGPSIGYPPVTSTETSATVTGLANGESYAFTVTARNDFGTGPASAPVTATPAGPRNAPSAPLKVYAAAAGHDTACVRWDPPEHYGGGQLQGYLLRASNGATMTASAIGWSTACFPGTLPDGVAHDIRVAALGGPDAANPRYGPFSEPSNSVTAPTSPPTPPVRLYPQERDGSATIEVPMPEFTGGATVTHVTVTASPGGQSASVPATSNWNYVTIGGLTNGTAYTFSATATNEFGTSVAGPASYPVRPRGMPSAPTNVRATAGDASAVVAWDRPASDGGRPIDYYTVTTSPGGAIKLVHSWLTSTEIAGLENGTSYSFTVSASNMVGDGPASAPSDPVTPSVTSVPPSAPTGVTAVAGDGRADVAWAPPSSDGGSAITGYTVTATPGSASVAVGADETSATVSGLANGTAYTFTVVAQNAIGNGPASAPSNSVTPEAPVQPPGPPGTPTAAAGDGSAIVSWVAAAHDGGSPITGYEVVASPGGAVVQVAGDQTQATVDGLANGTAHTFRVRAMNAVGIGPDSEESDPVTPATGAPEPETVTQTIDDGGGAATTDTGGGPTAGDPLTTTVVVPPGAGSGTLTVAETAVSVTPPAGGYQFLGQQVDITSDLATTAAKPLTIVMTVDETLLRAAYALGPNDPLPDASAISITRAEGAEPPALLAPCLTSPGEPIDPDPCIRERTYVGTDLRFTIETSSASHWNAAVRPVTATAADTGYTPQVVTVAQGGVVAWSFAGIRRHTVTETQRLGPASRPLFDSGLRDPGAVWGQAFLAAGTYQYGSVAPRDGKHAGTVAVPVMVTPAAGTMSTVFTIQWACRPMPGFVFDVEYRHRKAGGKSWSAWASFRRATAMTSATTLPMLGPGTYAIRARLVNASTGRGSGWSPETIVLTQP